MTRVAALATWALLFAAGGEGDRGGSPNGAQEQPQDPSSVRPARKPAVSELAREPVRRGVDYLLKAQNPNGSWGSGESARTYEILCDIPGSHHAFRAATTALCVMALARSPFREEECRAAVRRGLELLVDQGAVRRPNGMEMYNVWAFGYGLRAFAEIYPSVEDPRLRERILEASARIVKALEVYQTPDGGWGYYDFDAHTYRPSDSSMSFTTATILVSLHAIEKHGVAVPRSMLERAIKSIKKQRLEDGSYIYGPYMQYRPQHGVNKVKGSLGRTQVCNLALWLYGESITEDDLRSGIERLFRLHHFLDIARKRPIPHEAWYYNSGYFYYYGLFYAGLVLDLLPEPDRARWRAQLERLIVERQEPDDGSWWDYPVYSYGKPYGTAYALLTLVR
ncbi:MAG: hypothetical protein HY721_20445 [Planctomycetes bacterium]|nr:hypothetical protein [Planctomycetota bacterium]